MSLNKKLTLGILLTFIICIGSAILATYSTGPYGNYPNPGIHPGMIGPGTFNDSGVANPQWNIPGDLNVSNGLEVGNGVKIGFVEGLCNSSIAGTLRWNSTESKLEVCDGITWQDVGTSTSCNNPDDYYLGSHCCIETEMLCSDGLDNNCDGWTDNKDRDCGACVCEGTGYEIHYYDETNQTVYVDCNKDNCWTPTANSTYDWNSAIAYCDGLEWGGFNDWKLPYNELRPLCDSGSCSGTCFGGDGFVANYWTSGEYTATSAYCVRFTNCYQLCTRPKTEFKYVRCVRS